MITTKDKAGQTVYITYIEDCGENEGGYYCEVYADEDLMYDLDFFCVHPEDCDCSDDDAVEAYIREFVAEEYEFDLSDYKEWSKRKQIIYSSFD